jgi:hypothetical protein
MFGTLYGRWNGGQSAPAPRVALRAGRLHAVYQAGELGEVTIGGVVIVRRVYVGVRTPDWATVRGVLSDVQIDARADSFRITFTSTHREGAIEYAWRGAIVGTPDSRITFSMDGEALRAFATNRTGVCVLHPRELSGAPVTLTHSDGREEAAAFSDTIDPHTAIFTDLRALTLAPHPGVTARVTMDGDVWDTEDQRNWGDASYKSYNTRGGAPQPWQLEAGARLHQTITIAVDGADAAPEPAPLPAVVPLTPGDPVPLPHLGTCCRFDGVLTARQVERLDRLNLSQVRIDCRADETLYERLFAAWGEASAINASLELGLHFDADPQAGIAHLRRALAAVPMRGDILVFQDGQPSTPWSLIEQVQEVLENSGTVAVGGGTVGHFVDLNRSRASAIHYLLAVYAFSPQVHAFDEHTMIEALDTFPDTVRTARTFVYEPLLLSPVMLRQGWNPLDNTAGALPIEEGLPPRVDPRQGSLFGAGWTLGVIAAAARAGLESVTLYESVGWLGLMMLDDDPPAPDLFPAAAGAVFPVWHVLADVGLMRGEKRARVEVQPLDADRPFTLTGLLLRRGAQVMALIANLTPQVQTVTLGGLSAANEWTLRLLDAETFDQAAHQPEAFLEAGAPYTPGTPITLPPYALARLRG